MSRLRCLAAASCGLGAAALALLVPIVAACTEPNYSHVAQFISELGARGAAHPTLVAMAGFAPIGTLVLAFLVCAAGAFPRARRTTAGVACLGLVGVSYLVSAPFPCDPGCPASGSLSQSVHTFFGVLEYAGAVSGLLLLGTAFRASPTWKPLATASSVAAGVVAAVFLAMLNPELAAKRGLTQRLGEATIFAWIAVVSVFLLLHIRPELEPGR